jgi:hypothetical protein
MLLPLPTAFRRAAAALDWAHPRLHLEAKPATSKGSKRAQQQQSRQCMLSMSVASAEKKTEQSIAAGALNCWKSATWNPQSFEHDRPRQLHSAAHRRVRCLQGLSQQPVKLSCTGYILYLIKGGSKFHVQLLLLLLHTPQQQHNSSSSMRLAGSPAPGTASATVVAVFVRLCWLLLLLLLLLLLRPLLLLPPLLLLNHSSLTLLL